MTTFTILTFGCKVNQYESEALREAWITSGASEVEGSAEADVILVNSCAVTSTAVSDVRQAVRRLHRENPSAKIIVTGCAVASAVEKNVRSSEKLASLEGVIGVVDPRRKHELLHFFESNTETYIQTEWANTPEKSTFMPLSINAFKRSRPVVKVQDGCSHKCAYCIVPLTRGPARSRSASEIISEVRRLLEAGYREIMLSGVNLRQYANHEEGCRDFWSLLAKLDSELAPEWKGLARFRLSSVEPGQLDERGLETLANTRLLCPHLHISLQSGSFRVLERMGRGHYTPEMLLNATEKIRTFWHTFGLGADILMGFPAETEVEFRETLDFVRALPLTYAHVFPYSERPQTRAIAMRPIVPVPVRRERASAVRSVIDSKRRAFWDSLVGTNATLATIPDDGGVIEYYAPCRLVSGNVLPHTLAHVRIVASDEKGLLAEQNINQ